MNIRVTIPVRHWIDKATKYHIVYSKKYDISAYGKTKKKAIEMFNFTVLEILNHTKPKKNK